MENNKIYIFSFAVLTLIATAFITFGDSSEPLAKEMNWVLNQLPEVKSLEYLEALKRR
jgi:hypothetical protein